MSTLGIIVEYNPFHNGHLYHLNQAKKLTKAETTVAVMSGSFLQRGEPAIVDKWSRTKMALAQGVDLVVELPTIYSSQAADWFAYGSTFLLHNLFVDHLVFGSESDSLEILDKVSDLLVDEPVLFKQYLKKELSLGHSYPKALSLSLNRFFKQKEYTIATPNDILGIQYMQNLKKMKSSIKVNTIKRFYAQYHDKQITDQPIASATAIRKAIFTNNKIEGIKNVVPDSTYQILKEQYSQNRLHNWDNFLRSLLIIASSQDNKQLKNIHGVTEGFEQRIKDYIFDAGYFENFVQQLKTKRYTVTKIQRTLLYILLNLTNDKVKELNVEKGPQYIRVLGFNEKGRAYLNKIKHDLQIPLITNIPRDKPYMLELDIIGSMIYELGFPRAKETINEYKQAPIYEQNHPDG